MPRSCSRNGRHTEKHSDGPPAAYAVVAYQTAYLKCHYPQEYMAALLSSVLGWSGKVAEYMEECKRLGLSVLPPHVNHSGAGFTVDGG